MKKVAPGTRVLVTGSSGFLGSHVVQELRALGCDVIGVCRSTGFDLLRETDALTAILTAKPSVVIHLAAPVVHPQNDGSTFHDTLKMGMNVLDATAIIGAKFVTVAPRTIYAPSSFFALASVKGIVETHLSFGAPADAQGEAKQAIAYACKRYHGQYNRPYSILVLSSLYGASFGTEIGRMIKGIHDCMTEPEFWFSGMHGEDKVEHLFVEDAAKAVVMASLENIPSGVMNIPAHDQEPRAKLAAFISDYLEYKGKVNFVHEKPAPFIPLSGDLSLKALGWKPTVVFPEGLRRVLDELIGNKKAVVPA